MATEFDEGLLVGLLIGEGHFGGDGRQPQITLRMHERHEALFRWLVNTFPGARLYGPYDHGGRRYYQWMARGAYLRDHLVPLLHQSLSPSLDHYAYTRFLAMCDRYARQLGIPPLPLQGSESQGALARQQPEPPDALRRRLAAAAFDTLRQSSTPERSSPID